MTTLCPILASPSSPNHAEPSQGTSEILSRHRLECHAHPSDWMVKGKAAGMKSRPLQALQHSFDTAFPVCMVPAHGIHCCLAATSIRDVRQEGMPNMLGVHPDLVGAPRLQPPLHQRCCTACQLFQNLVVAGGCPAAAAAVRVRSHALAVGRVAVEVGEHAARRGGGAAQRDGLVGAAHRACLELRRQVALRSLPLGHHQQPAGAQVQPVHDARPQHTRPAHHACYTHHAHHTTA
mmetsp:Transcript_22291/g.56714  ORF Transcript_22291/g.56714 Transcript_22291/m.56714 type:complete len:235 (-) Transcript_22291:1030-1734(-)